MPIKILVDTRGGEVKVSTLRRRGKNTLVPTDTEAMPTTTADEQKEALRDYFRRQGVADRSQRTA